VISSLPGLPWAWNWSASWAVKLASANRVAIEFRP
jgi:hypothetical protein